MRTLALRDCRSGPVVLAQATIDGQLDLRGTRLITSGEPALQADGLTVIKDMLCGEAFHAEGGVRLVGANIGGNLDFNGALLEGKDGPALSADRLKVAQNMFCGKASSGEPFRATGEVRLMWAQIGGQLVFRGAQLTGSKNSAVNAHGITVTGDMLCDLELCADCDINLTFAKIGGGLNFSFAKLSSLNGPVLVAIGLSVAGVMQCEGLQGDGGVNLVEAAVGSLDFNGAHLTGNDRPALDADGLSVTGAMVCSTGFKAEGGVRLTNGNIGGYLDFNGAFLEGKNGPALSADRLQVAQNMFCGKASSGEPFRATGEVRLMWAQIGGQLSFRGAQLTSIPQTRLRLVRDPNVGRVQVSQVPAEKPRLNVYGIKVAGDMICDDGFRTIGGMNLMQASIGVLNDDKNDWPEYLWLDGLTYRDLSPYLAARDRLDWLGRSSGYHGQPYEQLQPIIGNSGMTTRRDKYYWPNNVLELSKSPGGNAGGDGSKMDWSATVMPLVVLFYCFPQHSCSGGLSSRHITQPQ